MVKKKKRSRFIDDLIKQFFGDIPDPFMGGTSTGYSIEMHQTPEGTIVRARVFGDVDKEAFKEQLKRMYPGAKIVIEGEDQEEESKEEISETTGEGVTITFSGGKPIISGRRSAEIKVEKVEKIDTENETEENDESGSGKVVRIEFKGGKPIIKKK